LNLNVNHSVINLRIPAELLLDISLDLPDKVTALCERAGVRSCILLSEIAPDYLELDGISTVDDSSVAFCPVG
jgi:hypothetical protein